jgi:hypothetical protein
MARRIWSFAPRRLKQQLGQKGDVTALSRLEQYAQAASGRYPFVRCGSQRQIDARLRSVCESGSRMPRRQEHWGCPGLRRRSGDWNVDSCGEDAQPTPREASLVLAMILGWWR